MRKKLSLIIPTLNNEPMIEDFFQSLSRQTFPKDQLEVLVLDGGSGDKTVEIAKKYGAAVIPNPQVLAEPAVTLGLSVAQGELLMVLAVDNFFHDPDALSKITQTFDDPEIYAAFPKHDSDNTDTIFSRYYNVFTDPFNHFVYGYAANARSFRRIYRTIKKNDLYAVYDYSSYPDRPMLALAQGMTLRAGYRREERDAFDDCRPVLDLLDRGEKIAYVHAVSLYHHTIRDFDHFIRKQRWATKNALSRREYGISHRKVVLSKAQRLRLRLWPLYALTFIFPTMRALWGLARDRQALWLLHPPLCMASALASLAEVVANRTSKPQVSRQ